MQQLTVEQIVFKTQSLQVSLEFVLNGLKTQNRALEVVQKAEKQHSTAL